jgi:hypothetical protein
MARRRDEIPTGVACTTCRREIPAPIEWREREVGPITFARTNPLAPFCKACAKRIDAKSKRR